MDVSNKKDYGSWNIKELKAELGRRKAKKSGRKRELVHRLEDYDRNQDFGGTQEVVEQYMMELPDGTHYKDVNNTTKLPSLSMKSVEGFLSGCDKILDDKAKNLYLERFLLCLRSSHQEDTYYLRTRCAAEMCKSVVYQVDISLEENGAILECQCECAVGTGPNAHCKHVQCLLYALVCVSNGQDLIVQKTCTEQLQTFHKCKSYKGSPLKSTDLSRHSRVTNRGIQKFSSFDPRPARYVRMEGYSDYFKNACVGFQSTHDTRQRMPILQTIPPANIYAIVNDHDYRQVHPEEQFLRSIGTSNLSKSDIERIEAETRGQATTSKWYSERCVRLQSSNFGRICKATNRTDRNKLAQSFLTSVKVKADAIDHGRRYEPIAIKQYEKVTGVVTQECGIFVCEEHPYLGSSPDRILNDDVIVEVKCPYSSRDKEINHVTVPYLIQHQDELLLNKDNDYYYQVQGQMLCTGRKACDFVIYTTKDIKIIRIQRDPLMIQSMVLKLKIFYNDYARQAILDQYLYKKTDKYILHN